MDPTIAQLVFDEVFPALEALEAQNRAILQFLKERGIASDKDFAPFLEQATNASSVRWRAARVRADHLLSAAAKAMEVPEEKPQEAPKTNNKDQQAAQESREKPTGSEEGVEREERKAVDSSSEGDRGTGRKEDKGRGPEGVKQEKPAGKGVA